MSVGIPVVVSDIPTHMEAIGADGPGHRAFADGDEESLLGALQRALANPAEELVGARVLRNEILSTYTWEQCAELVERVYAHVIRIRPSQRRDR
jgi:glycosyltransferase involved in cell wall biosynthesis